MLQAEPNLIQEITIPLTLSTESFTQSAILTLQQAEQNVYQ